MEEHFTNKNSELQAIEKFEFNLATGEVTRNKLFEITSEFPVINQDFIGRKNRYFYFVGID